MDLRKDLGLAERIWAGEIKFQGNLKLRRCGAYT